MMNNLENKIQSVVNQWIEGSDIFIVEIKVSPSKIKVFIDKPTGITIEECTSLSRRLNQELEDSGVLESHEMEVSSPGMDQPLKVVGQYKRRVGRELKVKLNDGMEVKGLLKTVDDNGIEIIEKKTTKKDKKKVTVEEEHKVLFDEIKEAKLVMTFKF